MPHRCPSKEWSPQRLLPHPRVSTEPSGCVAKGGECVGAPAAATLTRRPVAKGSAAAEVGSSTQAVPKSVVPSAAAAVHFLQPPTDRAGQLQHGQTKGASLTIRPTGGGTETLLAPTARQSARQSLCTPQDGNIVKLIAVPTDSPSCEKDSRRAEKRRPPRPSPHQYT